MNDLGLDSLDHVEVIMAMEDEFGKFTFILIWFKVPGKHLLVHCEPSIHIFVETHAETSVQESKFG